jgi:hypothetical protein
MPPSPKPPCLLLNPRSAPRGTRILHRPRRHCPRAAWLCRRPGLARCTQRPLLSRRRRWPPIPEPPRAFSAAGQSLTATGPPAVLAAIPSAPSMVLLERPASSPAVPVPSIPRALPPAVTPAQAELEHPEHAPALAHVPALDHPAPAARLVQAAQHRPAKHHAPRVPHREDAADARSIPRRRKAQ